MAAVTQHGKDILHPQRAASLSISFRANADTHDDDLAQTRGDAG